MQTAYPNPSALFAAQRRFRAAVLALSLLGGVSGCISAPPPKPNLTEQARHENALSSDLARQFEAKLHYRSDPEVDRYLDGVAAMLSATSGDPRLTGMRVVVIADPAGQWRSFSLPGRKIYLPIGLLRQLRYDNEVAAVIALEDGNITTKHMIAHLSEQLAAHKSGAKKSEIFSATPTVAPAEIDEPAHVTAAVDFFGPSGIFSFNVDEMKGSIRSAIQLMYGAGFDIRGMIDVWERLQENPAHSPFPPEAIDELLQFTRDTISMYAPLRDPIVGTNRFQSIRERIQNL